MWRMEKDPYRQNSYKIYNESDRVDGLVAMILISPSIAPMILYLLYGLMYACPLVTWGHTAIALVVCVVMGWMCYRNEILSLLWGLILFVGILGAIVIIPMWFESEWTLKRDLDGIKQQEIKRKTMEENLRRQERDGWDTNKFKKVN